MPPDLNASTGAARKQRIEIPPANKFLSLSRDSVRRSTEPKKELVKPIDAHRFKAHKPAHKSRKPVVAGSTSPQTTLGVPRAHGTQLPSFSAQRPGHKHAGRPAQPQPHALQYSQPDLDSHRPKHHAIKPGRQAAEPKQSTEQSKQHPEQFRRHAVEPDRQVVQPGPHPEQFRHHATRDHGHHLTSGPPKVHVSPVTNLGVTAQSTPTKEKRAQRLAPVREPALSTNVKPARALKGPHIRKLPCTLGGEHCNLQYDDEYLLVGRKSFHWRNIEFEITRPTSDAWKFRLKEFGKGVLSFIMDYENYAIFKGNCSSRGVRAYVCGDHSPPESLNKAGGTREHANLDLDQQLEGSIIDEKGELSTSITLNRHAVYLSKSYKVFEWHKLSVVPRPREPGSRKSIYELFVDFHHVMLKLGDKEAAKFMQAVQAYGGEVKEPASTLDDARNGLTSPPYKPRLEPKSESSPKSEAPPRNEEADSSSSLSSAAASRQRILERSHVAPKPTSRARRESASRNEREISPETFYGRTRGVEPETAASQASSSPSMPSRKASGESAAQPINLMSPDKPGRRLRRHARLELEDLTDEAAPVEPTDEDFKILRNAGYHRVAHRFWDGRLMEVSVEDIARLNPRIYLNDTIIWFFLRWYLERLYTQDRAMFDKILLLNTFFFPEMRKGETPKWVMKLPILTKHVIVMPVHEEQLAHWTVVIIIGLDEALKPESSTKPAVVVLDSLGPTHNHRTFRKVVSVLRRVLSMHNKPDLTVRDFRPLRTSVPVQTNLTDCGVYLLHFVEQILEKPDEFLAQVEEAEGRTLDMGGFWREPELQTKRDELKHRLKRLGSEDHSAEIGDGASGDDDDIEIVGMEEVRKKRRRLGSQLAPSSSPTFRRSSRDASPEKPRDESAVDADANDGASVTDERSPSGHMAERPPAPRQTTVPKQSTAPPEPSSAPAEPSSASREQSAAPDQLTPLERPTPTRQLTVTGQSTPPEKSTPQRPPPSESAMPPTARTQASRARAAAPVEHDLTHEYTDSGSDSDADNLGRGASFVEVPQLPNDQGVAL